MARVVFFNYSLLTHKFCDKFNMDNNNSSSKRIPLPEKDVNAIKPFLVDQDEREVTTKNTRKDMGKKPAKSVHQIQEEILIHDFYQGVSARVRRPSFSETNHQL